MPDETSEPMSDNAALNAMVAELEEINDFLTAKYDTVKGDGVFILVDDAHPKIRGAEVTAVKTVVTNKGPNSAQVRENGVLVMLVPSGTQRELPLSGKKALRIQVSSGETANVAIATYTKA